MAVNLVSALGAGSGVDVKSLAESLVDAERTPQKDRIDAKIAKSEARISGYGAMKFALSDLKAAFQALDDARDFNSLTAKSSQAANVGITATSSALAGSYAIAVTQLASAQRSGSAGFAKADTVLNGGTAFTLQLAVNGGAASPINVATATPEGMVKAINDAGLGLTAKLMQTSSSSSNAAPFTVVVTGEDGLEKSFTLGSDDGQGAPVAGVSFSTLKPASDAVFTVDSQTITRPSNTISDLIPGVTLSLTGLTTGEARLDMTRDTSAIKASLDKLVTTYNDFQSTLTVLADSKSDVEKFGGSLAGDRLLQTIRNQVRQMVVTTSSTPGATIKAGRDVGLSIDRDGKMTLDAKKLDAALKTNFSEVQGMFSAGTDDKSIYSSQSSGLAGDAVVSLDKMLRTTGLITTQTVSVTKDIAKYKVDLTNLQERMDRLLARYTTQFGVMDSIVGESKSMRTNLQSSFDGMMASYK